MKRIIFVFAAIVFAMSAFAQQEIKAEFPKATIGGKSSGEITVNEIISAGQLLVTNPELKITHFIFKFKIGEEMVTASSDSDKITTNMMDLIKGIKPGDRLYMDEIKATKQDGTIIDLPPQPFIIK